MPSDTIIKYGNQLTAGQLQPGFNVVIDAYGLMQGQATFAIDTASAGSVLSSLAQDGIAFPADVGDALYSYKAHLLSSKGDVSMITVDYVGIVGGNQTTAQITGVSNTSAQPIEAHPNFSEVTDGTIGAKLAGYPDTKTSWVNNAIFASRENIDSDGNKETQYSFVGFGVTKDADGEFNKKAGIRQFLKPMQNVRGTIFFDGGSDTSSSIAAGIGRTLSGGGLNLLIPNNAAVGGAIGNDYCLLTAANIEMIGNTESPVVIKVVYDIMISGNDPWDPDIYGEGF
jgi:hypothetical protein